MLRPCHVLSLTKQATLYCVIDGISDFLITKAVLVNSVQTEKLPLHRHYVSFAVRADERVFIPRKVGLGNYYKNEKSFGIQW